MSSSPEGSPTSASAGSGRTFSMSRDKFSIDIASPRLQLATNGTSLTGNGTNGNRLNSPSLKSPAGARRMASFSRDGILGSAQKARNLSQSSGDREQIVSGLHGGRHQTNGSSNGNSNGNGNGNGNGNSNHNNTSDDGINPLKRRSTDAGIDYPRRRATIAVSDLCQRLLCILMDKISARYADHESRDVMEPNPSASSVPN